MADESQRVPQQTHPAQGGAKDPNRVLEAEKIQAREKREKEVEKSQLRRTPTGSAGEKMSNAMGGFLGGTQVMRSEGLDEEGDAPYETPRHNGGEWKTPKSAEAAQKSLHKDAEQAAKE